MKKLIGIALTLLAGSILSMSYAQERIALVDFMYVPEGLADAYVTMEKEIAKPIHEEIVKQGKMSSWSLWQIPFPGGTGAEYQYATVRIYSSNEQLGAAANLVDIAEKVHAGKDMDKIWQTVVDTRDLVKTHKLSSWEIFVDDSTGPFVPGYIQVVYFKVPLDGFQAYAEMEKNVYHPMHKKEIEMGKRAGWEGWVLTRPMGSGMPYSHIAVDWYRDWDQYTADIDYEALIKEVHPGKTQQDLMKKHTQTCDLVRIEEWKLVDYVMAAN